MCISFSALFLIRLEMYFSQFIEVRCISIIQKLLPVNQPSLICWPIIISTSCSVIEGNIFVSISYKVNMVVYFCPTVNV